MSVCAFLSLINVTRNNLRKFAQFYSGMG